MDKRRDIRQEMMNVKGSEFSTWYSGLTNEEKLEYSFIFESLKNRTKDNGQEKLESGL